MYRGEKQQDARKHFITGHVWNTDKTLSVSETNLLSCHCINELPVIYLQIYSDPIS